MLGRALTEVRGGTYTGEPHLAHQTCHPLVVECIAFLLEPSGHPAHAVKRRVRLLLIQETHQGEVFCTLWHTLIIVAGSTQSEQSTLPLNRQLRVIRLD